MAIFDFLLNNVFLIIGIVVIVFSGLMVYIFYRGVKPERWMLFLSESERTMEKVDVEDMTAISLFGDKYTKRAIRFRQAYNWKSGRKNITTWFLKRALAYVHTFEDTPTGKAVKVLGSLWDGVVHILGERISDSIKDEYKQKLMDKEVWVSVDLERSVVLQDEKLPILTPEIIMQDTDKRMAAIFGEGVREGISKKDMIRDLALIAAGIGVAFLLQNLGILG